MRCFQRLVEWLDDSDDPKVVKEQNIDMIVPLSYGTTPEKLTDASERIFLEAIHYLKNFRDALTAFANASYCFPDAAKVEHSLKMALLRAHNVSPDRILIADGIVNSVQEAWAVRKVIREKGIEVKSLLLITGQMHTPSARFIWKRVLPEVNIFILCIPWIYEVQKDHPVIVQRSAWKWLCMNIIRWLALLTVGPTAISKIHHRV